MAPWYLWVLWLHSPGPRHQVDEVNANGIQDATHGVIEVLEALRQVRRLLPQVTAEMPKKNREKPRQSGI